MENFTKKIHDIDEKGVKIMGEKIRANINKTNNDINNNVFISSFIISFAIAFIATVIKLTKNK